MYISLCAMKAIATCSTHVESLSAQYQIDNVMPFEVFRAKFCEGTPVLNYGAVANCQWEVIGLWHVCDRPK